MPTHHSGLTLGPRVPIHSRHCIYIQYLLSLYTEGRPFPRFALYIAENALDGGRGEIFWEIEFLHDRTRRRHEISNLAFFTYWIPAVYRIFEN